MNSPGINFKYDRLQPNVIEGRFGKSGIKALAPMRSGAGILAPNEKISRKAMLLVVLVHMGLFAALINVSPIEQLPQILTKPMLVSLVASPAPEPEIVPLLPTPPKPEPVIKRQPKPKPVVQEHIPEPQPVAVEQPPALPAAITPEPQVVAKTPEPVIEPKIEQPRAQINPLESPEPPYPAQSRRMGEEGRVVLRILVSEKGSAETVQIETSSGFERLDQSALETVKKKWRFIPAKRNNQPISAYALVPIKFSLEN